MHTPIAGYLGAALLLGAGLAGPAVAQSRQLDSRGLPIGTDVTGNAARGVYNPYVSGTATSPWTQQTNGGTQQVPAPIPPPVTYGGAAVAPGEPAQRLYPAGTMKKRRELPPQYRGGGTPPAQAKLADCIASWDEASGIAKKQWISQCRRDYVRQAEESGKAKRRR